MKIIQILLLAVFLSGCTFSQDKSGTHSIIAQEFQAQIQNNSVLLVDIRTPQEFQSGHIENAINIDFYASDFLVKMNELPKDKPVYIYCRSGNRTGQAASKLKQLGFPKVVDLKGGIKTWSQINGKLVR